MATIIQKEMANKKNPSKKKRDFQHYAKELKP